MEKKIPVTFQHEYNSHELMPQGMFGNNDKNQTKLKHFLISFPTILETDPRQKHKEKVISHISQTDILAHMKSQ